MFSSLWVHSGFWSKGIQHTLKPTDVEEVMFTKPLVYRPDVVVDYSQDRSTINRLLAAAAISPRFRTTLLTNPQHALQTGFGGEQFPFSQQTYNAVVSIRASSLPDFVGILEKKVSTSFLLS